MARVGDGLHAVIAMVLVNPAAPDAVDRARAILEAHEAAASVPRRGPRWRPRGASWSSSANASNPPQSASSTPIAHLLDDGRNAAGRVDVVLETEEGAVILDHKSSPLAESKWPTEALRHSGQLAAYRDAFAAAGRPASTWIHFAVSGGAVRVE